MNPHYYVGRCWCGEMHAGSSSRASQDDILRRLRELQQERLRAEAVAEKERLARASRADTTPIDLGYLEAVVIGRSQS